MSVWEVISMVLSVIIAAIAALTDFRTGHIPNWLTYASIPVGIVLNGLGGQTFARGALDAVAGALVCALFPILLFYKSLPNRDGESESVSGGGDAKLFAALGALLGIYHGIEAEFFSLCAASIFALARLAWHGRLLRTLSNVLFIVLNPILPKKHRRTLTTELLTKMRIGGAILAGTCVAALARQPFWTL